MATESVTVPTNRAELIQRLAEIVKGASDRLGDDLRAFYPDEPAIHPDPLVGSLIDQAWGGPVFLDRIATRFQAAAVKPMFTRWHREIDGPRLVLVVERDDGSLVEWLELDVRELPERQDLLGRLGERTRNRLLQDAEHTSVAMATDDDEDDEQTGGDQASGMSATEARTMTEADILCEVRQLVGGDMERIAQVSRILQGDAEKSASQRLEAVELACEMEEMRERIKVAHALLESSIASLNDLCDLSGYIKTPMDRAMEARKAGKMAGGFQ